MEFLWLNNGFSILWLLECYCLGACIRLYFNEVSSWFGFPLAIVAVLLTWLNNRYGVFVSHNIMPWYTSPLVLLSAVGFLIGFSRAHLKSGLIPAISFFASTTFGIYIWHMHPLVVRYCWPFCKAYVQDSQPVMKAVCLVLIPVLVFLGCSLLEGVRMFLVVRITRFGRVVTMMVRVK